MNLESNLFSSRGLSELFKCLAQGFSHDEKEIDVNMQMKLTDLRLVNQHEIVSTPAEALLADSLNVNTCLHKLSFVARNLESQRMIDNCIRRNLDRRREKRFKERGSVSSPARARSPTTEIQDRISRISANEETDQDGTSWEVIAERNFLTLKDSEKLDLANGLANNTKLRDLKLVNCSLDDTFAFAFAEALKVNTTLEKLDLEQNNFSPAGIRAICAGLAFNKALVELKLGHQNSGAAIPGDDEKAIVEAVAANTSLTKLVLVFANLQYSQQVDRVLRTNADAKRNAKRRSVVGGGGPTRLNDIQKRTLALKAQVDDEKDEKNVDSLVEYIEDRLFISLKKEDKIDFANAFAVNRTVKTLKLIRLNLDDDWADAFAEALKVNRTLEEINLEDNKIGSDGIEKICLALASNSSVGKVFLMHQKSPKPLSSQAEDAIMTALENNEVLVKLGVPFRNKATQDRLAKRLNANQAKARKLRSGR